MTEELQHVSPAPQYTADEIPCDSGRTLIVDDEGVILKLYSRILAMEIPSIKVDVASNGVEALSSFGSAHHAVLIMDLHMPIMDGATAFQEIEKLCGQRNWTVPAVIFCTGYAPSELMSEILTDGPRRTLLIKPVTYDDIVGTVRKYLESASAI